MELLSGFAGAQLKTRNLNGTTPFHSAASSGHNGVCRFLLEAGL